MSMPASERASELGASRREVVLLVVALLLAGVIIGGLYLLNALPLAPYAPYHLSIGAFCLWAIATAIVLAFGVGHQRPRLILAAPFLLALVVAAIFALVLLLPNFTGDNTNPTGLLNYAITQSVVAYFTIVIVTFPGMIAGMIGSYFWHDR